MYSRIAMMGILNRSTEELFSPSVIKSIESNAAAIAELCGVAIAEVYSPWRVNRMCEEMGLKPGCAMDIRNGFDFDKYADRKKAKYWIDDNEPDLVIGSPLCTYFSGLQQLCKHVNRDNPKWLRHFHENVE